LRGDLMGKKKPNEEWSTINKNIKKKRNLNNIKIRSNKKQEENLMKENSLCVPSMKFNSFFYSL